MDYHPSRLQQEEGFTLVELIIGTVIVGLLVSAIGSAMVVSLRTTDVTTARFNESHDAQITSAYLANDVQSASGGVAQPPSSSNCAGSGTRLVGFNYSSSGNDWACYYFGISGGKTQVTRSYGGQTVVVAHFAGAGTPLVTCTPTACTTTPSTPDQVNIAFSEASGYAYNLLGSQRLVNSGSTSGTGASATVTLLVLGGGSPLWVSGSCPAGQIDNPGNPNNTCTSDTEVGSFTSPKLTVLGNLFVNSSSAGAVLLSGKKTNLKLDVEGGDFRILAGGTCKGCTPQTLACPNCTTTPPPGCTPQSPPPNCYTTPLLDPLRFMTAPDPTGLPTWTDGNYHGPGIYTTTLSIQSSTTFASGTYILNNGISITGSSTVSGSGVMLYNKGGGINFAGSSTVSLSPPTSGQYKGILIFQPGSAGQGGINTNALTLAGGTGISPIGIIYAPAGSSVTLGTGGATLRVTAVVAQNIKVSGSAQVTIG